MKDARATPDTLLTRLPRQYHDSRKRAWEDNARLWAAYLHCDGFHTQVLEALVGQVKEECGGSVGDLVDFGCGDGRFLRACATWEKCKRLVGVDFCNGMLAHAAQSTLNGKISYILHDVEKRLPLGGCRFDTAVAAFLFDEISSVENAFINIAASLVGNGRAFITLLDPEMELRRYGAKCAQTTRTAYTGEKLVIVKHFAIGNQLSPSPYFRILRPIETYEAAALRAGLSIERQRFLHPRHVTSQKLLPKIHLLVFRKHQ